MLTEGGAFSLGMINFRTAGTRLFGVTIIEQLLPIVSAQLGV